MEADWFADPLGRFDGRFFDGVAWTDRVSDRGVLAIDPDWPPIADAGNDGIERELVESADGIESAPPAVAPLRMPDTAKASLLMESPARVVAIVDQAVLAERVGSRPAAVNRRGRRLPVVGLVAVVMAIGTVALIFALWITNADDRADDVSSGTFGTTAPTVVADTTVVPQTATDTSTPSTSPSAPDTDRAPLADAGIDSDEPGAAIEVGGLRFVNGRIVLTELAEWHQGFTALRSVAVTPGGSCWFGRLGSAAVQNAFCGPVGGSAETEWLFDMVPLVFEDQGQGLTARPIVDAATIDVTLPTGLALIGPAEPPVQLPGRGERNSGDSTDGG